jgi:hypothetical protein
MTTITTSPPEPTPPSGTPPHPPTHRSLRTVVAIVLLGACAGVVLVLWLLHRRSVQGTGPLPVTAAAATGETRKIHAILFYVSTDGTELVQASREVAYGANPTEQARLLEEAQLAPAPNGFLSPIPTGTLLRAVFLAPHGEAYVDLSREVVSGHTGGSLDETLTVFAIVDAIAVNMPDISAVQILVDGHAVDSLTGHVDLRHPLMRSLRWVQKEPSIP